MLINGEQGKPIYTVKEHPAVLEWEKVGPRTGIGSVCLATYIFVFQYLEQIYRIS